MDGEDERKIVVVDPRAEHHSFEEEFRRELYRHLHPYGAEGRSFEPRLELISERASKALPRLVHVVTRGVKNFHAT